MENIIKISEAFRIALVSSVTNSFLFEFQKKKKIQPPQGAARSPQMPVSAVSRSLKTIQFSHAFIAFQNGKFLVVTEAVTTLPTVIPTVRRAQLGGRR